MLAKEPAQTYVLIVFSKIFYRPPGKKYKAKQLSIQTLLNKAS